MTSSLEHLLKVWTGKGRVYWMRWVEDRIASYMEPNTGENLCEAARTAPAQMKKGTCWLQDLVNEIWRDEIVGGHRTGDGNIAASIILSIILTLWSCRIMQAKGHSTNYSVKSRKNMLEGLVIYEKALLECMIDGSLDRKYFPQKEWESPYAKRSKK